MRRISLRSMFKESGPVSYMREALALRLLNAIGVPSQQSKYVRLFQNGAFKHSLRTCLWHRAVCVLMCCLSRHLLRAVPHGGAD